MTSTEADLGQNSLAREQFGTEADDKTEHGETAIPGFGKFNEAKASRRLSHVLCSVLELIECYDLRLPMAVYPFGSVLSSGFASH